MSFNRDFDSRGVKDALGQECRDMNSNDAVPTSERLMQRYKQEVKQRYQQQIQRRMEQDPTNKLLNNAYRQQCDIGEHGETPLIANLTSGMYFSDKMADGTRVQHRELLKPHGLASRCPSRMSATSSYNQGVINSNYHQPSSVTTTTTTAAMNKAAGNQQYAAPPCRSAAASATATRVILVDEQVQTEDPDVVVAATAPRAAGATTTTAQRRQQQQQEQEQEQQMRSHSRLGMAFPLRRDAKVAPNPIALLEAARMADELEREQRLLQQQRRPVTAALRRNQHQYRQQQQHYVMMKPVTAASSAAPQASTTVTSAAALPPPPAAAAAARPASAGANRNGARGNSTQLAVVGVSSSSSGAAAAPAPAPTTAAAAKPAISGGTTPSKVDTGRSTHTDALKHNLGRPKGEVAFGLKTDVAKYEDAAAAAEEERRLHALLPQKPRGPQLVPAVASREYATSLSRSRRAPFPSAQRYASDNYTSVSKQRQHPHAKMITYSPARGSLEQYTEGLFVGGQQVLKPHDVPKVGAIDVNFIAQGGRTKQRPASASVASYASRSFYY